MLNWIDCSSEFSETDFEIFILVQSSKDRVYVALIDIFIEFGHEYSYGIKIKVAVVFGVKDGETSHSVEISLPLKSFLLFFNFNMVVHFFFYEP